MRYGDKFCDNVARIVSFKALPIFASMKIAAFIMALMVLMLSFTSCVDGTYAMNKEKEHIEASKTQTPVDEDCNDNCSPFCTGNCCPGFAFSFESLQIAYLLLPSSEKLTAYLPADISEITLPVWQPPQLS